MRFFILTLIAGLVFCVPGQADALLLISEIHADPAASIDGDANGDGSVSSSEDEFVEFFNSGASILNLSGWKLNDAVRTRHVFAPDTLLDPSTYLVVYGGGLPSLSGISWQVASTGSLGLNNSGDTLSLFDIDNNLIEEVVYGSIAGQNQSIVRYPESNDEFVLHSSLTESEGRLYSPGTAVTGEVEAVFDEPDLNQNTAAVPGLPTWLTFLSGMVGIGYWPLKPRLALS